MFHHAKQLFYFKLSLDELQFILSETNHFGFTMLPSKPTFFRLAPLATKAFKGVVGRSFVLKARAACLRLFKHTDYSCSHLLLPIEGYLIFTHQGEIQQRWQLK